MKTCTKCKIEKSFDEFGKVKAIKSGYRSECKLCVKEYRIKNSEHIVEYRKNYDLNNKEHKKLYKLKNKERLSEQNKQYRLKNKDKYNQWRKDNKSKLNDKVNQYNKNRKQIDSLFKLTSNIRGLINNCIKRRGYKKTSKTQEILGCTFEEFKEHLENQFKDNMNWENQGKWHIDHIYPVSKATDEQHLIKLNHYTNLQPLWAIDNFKKGNRL